MLMPASINRRVAFVPFLLALILPLGGCKESHGPGISSGKTDLESGTAIATAIHHTQPIGREVRVKEYFTFLDSVIAVEDSLLPWTFTEYDLVRMNPWIIDSLVSMDYYAAKDRGVLLDDQKECIIFRPTDSLLIPSPRQVDSLRSVYKSTVIDVNIPEYRLRILQGTDTLHTFKVRVGKNTTTYLATAGRDVVLQTPVGVGEIVRIEKYAIWMNPVDGHRYTSTLRDDYRRTALPLIPWIEPSINGIRYGTLIHPTTNPVTLGRASSNGCVGMREGDMWQVYYHAPLGTKVVFRYDLEVSDSVKLRDIYQRSK